MKRAAVGLGLMISFIGLEAVWMETARAEPTKHSTYSLQFKQEDLMNLDVEGVAYDIAVKGDRALVGVLFGKGGVHSIGVSPEGKLSEQGFIGAGKWVDSLALVDDLVYVSGRALDESDAGSNPKLHIYDASNPDKLVETASLLDPRQNTSNVAVSGEFAYVGKFDWEDNRPPSLLKLDKKTLKLDGEIATAGHPLIVLSQSGYTLVIENTDTGFNGIEVFDEDMLLQQSIPYSGFPMTAKIQDGDLFLSTGEGSIYVYDLSALPSVKLRATIAIPDAETVTGLVREGDLLFASTWDGKLLAFDLSNWQAVTINGALNLRDTLGSDFQGGPLSLIGEHLLVGGSLYGGNRAPLVSLSVTRVKD